MEWHTYNALPVSERRDLLEALGESVAPGPRNLARAPWSGLPDAAKAALAHR